MPGWVQERRVAVTASAAVVLATAVVAGLMAADRTTATPARAAAAEISLCGQIPSLISAVDWTFQTWPPARHDVDGRNLSNLRYFTALVQADLEVCGQEPAPLPTALLDQTMRWHFGNASEALLTYQSQVQQSAAPFTGTFGPVESAGAPAPPVAILTEVRAAGHSGFDRAVFEFRDELPGYRVEYIGPPVTQDASGEPVEVAGAAFLRVRFRPATGWDGAAGRPAYLGPPSLIVELPALREVRKTGDFEATVTWVLGLTGQTRFRVLELTSPARLVIDVLVP